MSEVSDGIRKGFGEGDDVRDAGLTTPEDVVRFDDIVYGEDPSWQKLDVYRPADKESKKLPVIFSIHGGGWVYGDKERYQYYCMSLAQRGFAVVNFTYRLAPEFKFPAALEDTNLVVTWILSHADEYGFDADHIFAVGDSAGGHYLGLYTAVCTNPDYAKNYPFAVPEGFVPTAIALNCGVYKLTDTSTIDQLTLNLMKDLLPGKATDEELAMLSTLSFITEAFPPTLFMTCTGDFLKAQAPGLQAVLLDKNIPHEFLFFGNSKTELGHVFHLNMKSKEAAACNDAECAFFSRYL